MTHVGRESRGLRFLVLSRRENIYFEKPMPTLPESGRKAFLRGVHTMNHSETDSYRQEGLILCVVVTTLIVIVTLLTNFQQDCPYKCRFSFSEAFIYFSGFGDSEFASFQISSLHLYVALAVLLAYSLSRYLGLVRRLIPLEGALLNLIIRKK